MSPERAGLEEEPERRQWQVEIDGARQRSGRLLALLAAMVGSLVLLNTAVFNVPILTGVCEGPAAWGARIERIVTPRDTGDRKPCAMQDA